MGDIIVLSALPHGLSHLDELSMHDLWIFYRLVDTIDGPRGNPATSRVASKSSR